MDRRCCSWLMFVALLLSGTVCAADEPMQELFISGLVIEPFGHFEDFRRAPEDQLIGASFSPDGKVVGAVDARQNAVLLWHASTGREAGVIKAPAMIDEEGILLRFGYGSSFSVAPDNQTVAWANGAKKEGGVYFYNWKTETPIRELETRESYVMTVEFSPDGSYLIAGDHGIEGNNLGQLYLWDTKSNRLIAKMLSVLGNVAFDFAPDSKSFAVVRFDLEGRRGWIELCDAATGKQNSKIDVGEFGSSWIAYSADGTAIVSLAEEGIKIWDVATGTLKTLHPYEKNFSPGQIAVSPEGSLLAVSGIETEAKPGTTIDVLNRQMLAIHILDLKTGQCLQKLEHHLHLISGLAFSTDGKQLATSSSDGTLKLWDRVKAK